MMAGQGFLSKALFYHTLKKIFSAEIIVEFGDDHPDAADQEEFA